MICACSSEDCIPVCIRPRSRLVLRPGQFTNSKHDLAVMPFIAAVQDCHDNAADVAAKLVTAREADKANRGGQLKGTTAVCRFWTACLEERESISGDGAEVCGEVLRHVLRDHNSGHAAMLLDGFAETKCQVSPTSTAIAQSILYEDLSKDSSNAIFRTDSAAKRKIGAETVTACHRSFTSWIVQRVVIWIDILCQFHIRCVCSKLWLRARDALLADNRLVAAMEICAAIGHEEYVLDRIFMAPYRNVHDLVNVAPKVGIPLQKDIVRRLTELKFTSVADGVRRACSLGPRTVDLSHQLQSSLLDHLVKEGLRARVVELANKGGLEYDKVDLRVQNEDRSIHHGSSTQSPRSDAFRIESCSIHVVDSQQSLLKFIRVATDAVGVCGLDCEWQVGDDLVSILQVALGEEVWILDLAWARCVGQKDIAMALEELFSSPSIVKVGYGFQEDLNRLACSIPSASSCTAWVVHPYAELCIDNQGLANLLRQEVGMSLDKSLQCSAWAVRPLHSAQLKYAAADAMCLPRLFSAMRERIDLIELVPTSKRKVVHDALPSRGIADVRAAVRCLGLHGRFETDACESEFEQGNVVCFVINPEKKPVAVVTRANAKVSTGALAVCLGVSKRKVSLACSAECVQLFGYAPGLVPPIGLRPDVQVWLDEALRMSEGELWFSSGSLGVGLVCTWTALPPCVGDTRWVRAREAQGSIAIASCRIAGGSMPVRFICADPGLTRLAYRLRVLNLDVSLSCARSSSAEKSRGPLEDEVARRLKSLIEREDHDAVILTCSRTVDGRLPNAIYRLHSKVVEEQFWEVLAVFGIEGNGRVSMALNERCHLCNGKLKTVGRDHVLEQKFKTSDVRDVYFLCTNSTCEMKFWHSRTYCELREEVRHLVDEALF